MPLVDLTPVPSSGLTEPQPVTAVVMRTDRTRVRMRFT
jgi:hypothetical protein